MKRYRCNYVDAGINFGQQNVQICCKSAHNGGGIIILSDKYPDDSKLDWDSIHKTKKIIQDGLMEGHVPTNCRGCVFLEEIPIPENKICMVDVNSFVRCNCKCIYCNMWKFEDFDERSLLPVFKDMFEKGLLVDKDYGYISFAGGEPTIMLDFEKIIMLCLENGITNYVINSNGIIYSKAVEELLKRTNIKLVVSVDSGSKETYEKIKQVPHFDKVIGNLKTYVNKQLGSDTKVRSKFIIIPGMNDTFEEIKKWYDCSTAIGIKMLILDVEKNWFIENDRVLTQEIISLIEYIQNRCKEDGIMLDYFEQLKLFYGVTHLNEQVSI